MARLVISLLELTDYVHDDDGSLSLRVRNTSTLESKDGSISGIRGKNSHSDDFKFPNCKVEFIVADEDTAEFQVIALSNGSVLDGKATLTIQDIYSSLMIALDGDFQSEVKEVEIMDEGAPIGELKYSYLITSSDAVQENPTNISSSKAVKGFNEGDKVEGNYRGLGKWYNGHILGVREDGTYDIEYDEGEMELHVNVDLIRNKGEGAINTAVESSSFNEVNEVEIAPMSPKKSNSSATSRIEGNASPLNRRPKSEIEINEIDDDIEDNYDFSSNNNNNNNNYNYNNQTNTKKATRPATAKPSRGATESYSSNQYSNTEVTSTTDSNTGMRKKKRVKKGKPMEISKGTVPAWGESQSTTNLVRLTNNITGKKVSKDLMFFTSQKLGVRIHSVVMNGMSGKDVGIVRAVATTKVSIHPVPAKTSILRSKPADMLDLSSGSSAMYNFEGKTAVLGLSSSDMRSRLFKVGNAPRLYIETSFFEKVFQFESVVYLSSILDDIPSEGKLVTLPLIPIEKSESNSNISGSIVIEVFAKSKGIVQEFNQEPQMTVSDILKGEDLNSIVLECHKRRLAEQDSTIRPSTLSPELMKTYDAVVYNSGKADMSLDIKGIVGYFFNIQATPNLRLEYSLTASGISGSITLTGSEDSSWIQGGGKKGSNKEGPNPYLDLSRGFAIMEENGKVRIRDIQNPNLDFLTITLYGGHMPGISEDELGSVYIPLTYLVNTETVSEMELMLQCSKLDSDHVRKDFGSWALYVSSASVTLKDIRKKITARPAGAGTTIVEVKDFIESENNSKLPPGSPQRTVKGWTLDDNTTGTNNNNNNHNNTNVISGVKRSNTVSGILVGCVHGFITNMQNLDSDLETLDSSQFAVDMTLYPEGVKKSFSVNNGSAIKRASLSQMVPEEGYAFIEVSPDKRSFSIPLTTSSLQKKPAYLKAGVSFERQQSGDNSEQSSSSIMGKNSFDVTMLTTSSSPSMIMMLVPMLGISETATATKRGERKISGKTVLREPIGHLLVALSFSADSRNESQRQLEMACDNTWWAVTANIFPSSRLQSMLGEKLNAMITNVHQAYGTTTLQFALDPMDLSTTMIERVSSLMNDASSDVCLFMRVGDLGANLLSTETKVNAISMERSRLVWNESNICLSINLDRQAPVTVLSKVIYLNLVKVVEGHKVSIAESALIIPSEILHMGLPQIVSVPLRDSDGDRVGTINLKLHATSLGGNQGSTLPLYHQIESSAEIGPETNAVSVHKDSKINISVKFREGSIQDSSWYSPMEPFFECTLIPPVAIANSQSILSCNLKGRTSLILANKMLLHNNEQSEGSDVLWDLECELSIPMDCLPTPEDASKGSLKNWNMAIVCRDSTRAGCPTIGNAHVNVPWSVFMQMEGMDTSLERWIDFAPPKGNSKNPLAAAGKAHISISIFDKQDRSARLLNETLPCIVPEARTTGIGVVSFWVKNMIEPTVGKEEIALRIVSCTVTSRVLSLNSAFEPADEAGDMEEPFAAVTVSNHGTNAELYGSVPVSSGNSEIQLEIDTSHSRTPYSTSYPVMSTTTKPVDLYNGVDEVAPGIPELNLMALDSNNVAAGNAQTVRQMKRTPRVNLESAFIPYVQGTLLLAVHAVVFRGNVEGKFLSKEPRSGSMRAIMSSDSFVFSESFDLNVPPPKGNQSKQNIAGAGSASKQQFQVKGKEDVPIVARMTLPVDTYELAKGANSNATVHLSLLDLDASMEGGKEYCLGHGKLETASLYYQALRAAAGSKLPSKDLMHLTKNADIFKDGNISASPWGLDKVDIIDPTLNKLVATCVISSQFVANSIPRKILSDVDTHLGLNNSASSTDLISPDLTLSSGRVELMLKKVFLDVDKDHSGTVDAMELVSVIESERRRSSSMVGDEAEEHHLLEAMMISLAGFQIDSSRKYSTKELRQAVMRAFSRLDVDGDGIVSWWEWRRVLIASLVVNPQESSKYEYIQRRDALLIGILAANDAIQASLATSHKLFEIEDIATGGGQQKDNGDSKNEDSQEFVTTALLNIPYARINTLQNDTFPGLGLGALDSLDMTGGSYNKMRDTASSSPLRKSTQSLNANLARTESEAAMIMRDPLDDLPSDIPAAKAVPRLQNMIRSLRYTNNSLTKRLESAISHSQDVLDGSTSPRSPHPGMSQNHSPLRKSANIMSDNNSMYKSEENLKQEVFRATRRAQDAELQQEIMAKALEFEKLRAQKLEVELSQAKRLAYDVQSNLSHQENIGRQSREAVQQEIASHKTKIQSLQDRKKKRMESIVLLGVWLRKYVLPKIRYQLQVRKEKTLGHHLGGMIQRKKYLKEKEKRDSSASKLQAGLRGLQSRKKMQQMQQSAKNIQKIIRGKKARDLRRRLLLEKAAAAFSTEFRAASVLSRCLLKWLLKVRQRKDAAARILQKAHVNRKNRIQGRHMLQERKEILHREKEEHTRRHASSVKIQSVFRGKKGRKDFSQKRIEKSESEAKLIQEKQAAAEIEKQKLAALYEKLATLKSQQRNIKEFWTERDSVLSVKRPNIKDAVGFWVVLRHGSEFSHDVYDMDKEIDPVSLEQAKDRFTSLTSVQIQLKLSKEADGRTSSFDVDAAGTFGGLDVKIETQEKVIKDMEYNREEVNLKVLADAYVDLADMYLELNQDYVNAFEMYKRSYMTLKSDKHVDPKAYMADRLKMMAYTAFKCGDYIAMETYCGDLLRECGTLFGMGSLEHALAEVFVANLQAVSPTKGITENILGLLGDAVATLISSLGSDHLVAVESNKDLAATRIVVEAHREMHRNLLSRAEISALLGRVETIDPDSRILHVRMNNTSESKVMEVLTEDTTYTSDDFASKFVDLPYDHPKLDWYATPDFSEKLASSGLAFSPSPLRQRASNPNSTENLHMSPSSDLKMKIIPSTSTLTKEEVPLTYSPSPVKAAINTSIEQVIASSKSDALLSTSSSIEQMMEGNVGATPKKQTITVSTPRDPHLVDTTSDIIRKSSEIAKKASQKRQDLLADDDESQTFELEEIDRPPLSSVADGYIISYSQDGKEMERTGHVHGVDAGKRLLVVAFTDQQDDPHNPRLEFISYDHPHLYWFLDNLYDKKLRLKEHRKNVAAITRHSRPNSIHDAIGFIVEIPNTHENAQFGEFFRGKVVAINAIDETVKVAYHGEEDHDEVNHEDFDILPFKASTIAWMEPPPDCIHLSLVARPPLADAVGYVIELKSQEEVAEHGDMWEGRVVEVDLVANTMLVSFSGWGEDVAEKYHHHDTETVGYTSKDVSWMRAPKKEWLVKSTSPEIMAGKESVPSLDLQNLTEQQKQFQEKIDGALPNNTQAEKKKSFKETWSTVDIPPISKAMGYTVEVALNEDGDAHVGTVISVDEQAGVLMVDFEVEEGDDPDIENILYDNDNIAFTAVPVTKPIIVKKTHRQEYSTVPVPAFEECLGYEVEMALNEDGDAHAGVIIEIEAEKRIVLINFEVEDGEPEDKEHVAFDSNDLAFTRKPSAPKVEEKKVELTLKVDSRVEAHWNQKLWLKGVVTRASDGTYDVEYDDDTMDYDLPPDQVRAVVKASLEDRMAARMAIQAADKEKTQAAPALAPALEVIKKSEPFKHKHSIVDAPTTLEDALGYVVEIESDESPDDMFTGTVVGVQTMNRMIRVSFEVEEGEESDYEMIDFDSHKIAWRKTPTVETKEVAKAPVMDEKEKTAPTPQMLFKLHKHRSSKLDPPADPTQCVGYGVEIESEDTPGDFFPGTVVSVDTAKRTFRVSFEVDEGEEEDFEDVSFDSKGILWMTPPSKPANIAKAEKVEEKKVELTLKVDSRVEAHWNQKLWLKGVVTRASDGTYDVEYDDDTMDYDLPPDQVRAVVKASLEDRMAARMAIQAAEKEKVAEKNTTATEQKLKAERLAREAEHEPLEVEKKPAEKKEKTAPTPQMLFKLHKHRSSKLDPPADPTQCVGYGVEIESEDTPGDFFPGTVVSVDTAKRTFRVSFEVDEGEEEDFEDVSFDSKGILWMEEP